MLKPLLILAGAAITVGSTAIMGLRVHKLVLRYVPGAAAWIPRDGGVVVGVLVGAAVVAGWLVG